MLHCQDVEADCLYVLINRCTCWISLGVRTDGRKDGQTDGRMLPSTLSPCFAVDSSEVEVIMSEEKVNFILIND